VARGAKAARADIVVNTGGISLDGVNKAADLSAAFRPHRAFDRTVLFISLRHGALE
jgi:hypothetical protein